LKTNTKTLLVVPLVNYIPWKNKGWISFVFFFSQRRVTWLVFHANQTLRASINKTRMHSNQWTKPVRLSLFAESVSRSAIFFLTTNQQIVLSAK
jgi:hypothetical protein